MQITISAASFLALVSAVMAQTPGFDAITTPLKSEVVPAGSSYVIKWDYTPTYAGTISIQLLEGASPTTLQLGPVLASGIDNSLGAFTWAVDSALGADTTYGIKIIYDGDATGATFQYSNPFSISKAAAEISAPSSYPVAANPGEDEEPSSTLYSTAWVTITSCAATVTDCPARSTVVSSTLVPATTTGAGVPPVAPSAPATTVSSSSPVVTAPPAPVYPVGNATVPGGAGSLGTVTLPKTTAGSAPTTTPVVTAGAGRVVAGGLAAAAGLFAAFFAL